MMAKNKRIVTFSLDVELLERLENLADARRVSRSRLAEDYIRDGLEQEGTVLNILGDPKLRQMMAKVLTPDALRSMAQAMGHPAPPEKVEQFLHKASDVASEVLGTEKGKRKKKGK